MFAQTAEQQPTTTIKHVKYPYTPASYREVLAQQHLSESRPTRNNVARLGQKRVVHTSVCTAVLMRSLQMTCLPEQTTILAEIHEKQRR
jgi:non-ribosomal peptide synthetase component F